MSEKKICPACPGGARWLGKRCDVHNRCSDCGISCEDYGQAMWGLRNGGLQCEPCNQKQIKQVIEEFQASKNEYSTYAEINIKCPWCGTVDDDSWEYKESDAEIDCGYCENSFSMELEVSVTYTTTKNEVKP